MQVDLINEAEAIIDPFWDPARPFRNTDGSGSVGVVQVLSN